ncbi:MAG: hypothetical protein II244_04660 [Clostridia bacterium]|nr:hypothetical protein [Clostridia bacterium]
MSNYPTDKLTSVFAVNGDKRLPPATAALAGSGRASQYEGFKIENSMPLSQGGIPPFREDFNGIFNLFSQFLMWYQQGGVMQYDNSLDYEVNNEVYYNGLKYRCIQDNGVSSTVANPTDTTYWEKIHNYGDPVRYGAAQSLTSGEQLQARTNINAVSGGDFNTLVGSHLSTDSDYLALQSINNDYLSKLPWSTFPNLFGRNSPAVITALWSGDINMGDMTLLDDFTDYDCLMFMGGAGDTSPGSTQMVYNFVPVWFLKECIINHSFMGVSMPTIEIIMSTSNWWRIDCANSTTTVLKWYDDYGVHMWRVFGIRFTSSVNPQPV